MNEACRHSPGSKERQQNLTQIIRLVDSQLWRESTPYYEDALQETWIYFCQNICEGNSGKVYDPDKAGVVTWLNNYLRWRLKDGYIKTVKQNQQKVSVRVSNDNKIIDPVDNLPAKSSIPPLLEEIEQWVLADSQNKLRQIYVENHPQITAQTLILSRLPPETPWKQLAAEYGVSAGTLSSFYQRKCKPLLREFSKSQGYV
ncbi:sigma-70 family RNA polymerase sigma factor [Hyella patelloides]|uniref:sigma-70 family RNA polymerase sigma factor n=1 Tax=Hyella patelloides TaxID=1982969 RepID=UPI001C93F6BC|nr:sigma-70 family RNA polymerase sigma factor [Hyella patelloides]